MKTIFFYIALGLLFVFDHAAADKITLRIGVQASGTFDWELAAKLVRAGYVPIEIPVNYSSRSFKEGKKVSFWRDPFTYFRACFKYRFVRLGK